MGGKLHTQHISIYFAVVFFLSSNQPDANSSHFHLHLYFSALVLVLRIYFSAPPNCNTAPVAVLHSVPLIKNTTCCCRLFSPDYLLLFYFHAFIIPPSSSSSSPFLSGLAACSTVPACVRACARACACVLMHGGPNEFDSCHLISVMRVAVLARGARASGRASEES